jgi:hypothetical protein
MFLAAAVLLFSSLSGWSHEIYGQIVNQRGKPMAGALVELVRGRATQVPGPRPGVVLVQVYANAQGLFSIGTPGSSSELIVRASTGTKNGSVNVGVLWPNIASWPRNVRIVVR